MPLVKIEILAGHTKEYKEILLQSVHEALVTALGIPDDDRLQRLYELNKDCFENTQSDKFTIIELTFFPGRSKDMKRSAFKEIVRLLCEKLNMIPSDIMITINEPPLDNWCLRGEQACELGIKYKK